MSRPRLVAGAAGILLLVASAACTGGNAAPTLSATQSSVAPPTPSPQVHDVASIVGASDQRLAPPAVTTPLSGAGLIEDRVDVGGSALAVSTTGEILAGQLGADTYYHRVERFRIGGTPQPVDASYQRYTEAGYPNGGDGAPSISEDAMAWLAYLDARDDLNIADFVVYAADSDGRNIRRIGQSSPDIPDVGTGRNVQVPFWRERLLLLGGRAYWMESVRLVGDIDRMPNFQVNDPVGVEVMSAPLDGSAPQRVTFHGWQHGLDLCSLADAPALLYLDSALSQAPNTGTASLHRATVDDDGEVTSDQIVWSAAEDGAYVTAASACGDTVAVSWVDWQPDPQTGLSASVLEIMHDGVTTTVQDAPMGGYFTDLHVTPHAVFFGGANGTVDGGEYVFDLDTGRLYRISQVMGYYDSAFVTRSMIAWREEDPQAADPQHPFKWSAAPLLG